MQVASHEEARSRNSPGDNKLPHFPCAQSAPKQVSTPIRTGQQRNAHDREGIREYVRKATVGERHPDTMKVP
jgi:hypothetical protein